MYNRYKSEYYKNLFKIINKSYKKDSSRERSKDLPIKKSNEK